MVKISEMIKTLRRKKDWTQQQLANELGITQHAVCQWETGKRSIDLETFQRLLDLLDASLSIKSSSLTSEAYRLETTDYEGSEIEWTFIPNEDDSKEVHLERAGLKLIIPRFYFGTSNEPEHEVMQAIGFDYALYEDCPTLADYLSNRGLLTATEVEIQEYEQLSHDMNYCLQFFDWKELAYIDFD